MLSTHVADALLPHGDAAPSVQQQFFSSECDVEQRSCSNHASSKVTRIEELTTKRKADQMILLLTPKGHKALLEPTLLEPKA